MAEAPDRLVLVDDLDAVRYLSLNRPEKHNAMDNRLVDVLRAEIESAIACAARVIVLRGEGKSFSSGRDTSSIGTHGDRSPIAKMRLSQSLTNALTTSRKPIVASLHGHVLGKACELALAADIRVAADDIQLGLPEIDHALVTDNGAATRIAVTAGPSRAKIMLMTGRSIDAGTALAWGLVDLVVPAAELRDATHDLARTLAAKPPMALSVAKELVDQVHAGAVQAGMRAEGLAQLVLVDSPEREELRTSRREGRAPSFPPTE